MDKLIFSVRDAEEVRALRERVARMHRAQDVMMNAVAAEGAVIAILLAVVALLSNGVI